MVEDERNKPIAVLAAGGTGGHIYPAGALAKELAEQGWQISLISDKKGVTYGLSPDLVKIFEVSAATPSGKTWLKKFIALLVLAKGVFQARNILKELHPRAVIGFGGYASFPTMIAAVLGNYKTIIHEQNSVMGKANRFLSNRVGKIATSFDYTEAIPDKAKRNVVLTGMPVRESLLKTRHFGYPDFGESSKLKILVLGGSQGASILSRIVPNALKKLYPHELGRVEISQQCRLEDFERLKEVYKGLGVKADISVFFNNIAERLKNCHLFIGRAGASTIAELKVVGRPSILVPYPFAADDHQSRNAFFIEHIGAGWLITEQFFTPSELAKRVKTFFYSPEILQRAAACAKAAGKPEATESLTELIINQNGNGSGQLSRCREVV